MSFDWFEFYGIKPLETKKGDKIGKRERLNYMCAARELGYGPKVIKRIKDAKTDIEISNIMADARNGRI